MRKLLGALLLSLFIHFAVLGGFRAYPRWLPTLAPAGDRVMVATLVERLPEGRVEGAPLTAANRLFKPSEGKSLAAAKPGNFTTGSSRLVPPITTIDIPLGRAAGPSAEMRRSQVVSATPMRELADAPSEDGVRQYRLSLARAARSYKQYPASAREGALEGDVVVTVSAAVGVGAPVVALGRSSGQPLLDSLALDLMVKATAQAPLPDILRGKQFVISVPVQYRQND
ncbi:hypothetical protein [Dechloromonas denitrificans]|uniref:hypothetical protein n=1 Tax=Dechloromonas denitrificans TaxID=281362 RepID=UPI001CFC2E7C|nr:hypothetical protein [Dechloromonas denitrificans]UCV08843.1 hypothetical protein KI615_04730 [Dechloromonas denitrificans]